MEQQTHTYLTLSEMGEGFYKEKGSKFYGFALPCKNEEEAKVHLNNWRKEHHQAVHVCYAFRFGSDKKKFRSSDDGEPSNSAGPPILGQIQSFDVTNVLVAVVRYYGGVNLGVGGLIHAYRTAAKEALENASLIEREDEYHLELQFDYPLMPTVMGLLKQGGCKITEQDFQLTCKINLLVPVSNQQLILQLTEIKTLTLLNHGIAQ